MGKSIIYEQKNIIIIYIYKIIIFAMPCRECFER